MECEYIKEIVTEQTGGGCMVDYIVLKSGHVIGVNDEVIVHP